MMTPNNPVNSFGITHGLSTSQRLFHHLFKSVSLVQGCFPTNFSWPKTFTLSRENRLVHTQGLALSTIAIH